jgi:hypothetical protein
MVRLGSGGHGTCRSYSETCSASHLVSDWVGYSLAFGQRSWGFYSLAPDFSQITSAAKAAEALAKDEYPKITPLSIREVVLLGQSLELAANLLSQRERERAEIYSVQKQPEKKLRQPTASKMSF